jgi:hypothetical protein
MAVVSLVYIRRIGAVNLVNRVQMSHRPQIGGVWSASLAQRRERSMLETGVDSLGKSKGPHGFEQGVIERVVPKDRMLPQTRRDQD